MEREAATEKKSSSIAVRKKGGLIKSFFAPEDKDAQGRRVTLSAIVSLLMLILVLIGIFLTYSYSYYLDLVDARLATGFLKSRAGIYAAPRTLRVGQQMSNENLVGLLQRAGYVENAKSDVWSGSFINHGQSILIYPHASSKQTGPGVIQISVSNNQISKLLGDNAPLDEYQLEPELLTNSTEMKGDSHKTLDYKAIPQMLVHAILAVEDRRFFEHGGLDLRGLFRAFFSNLTNRDFKQGGSTITQQLVKNTFLSPERTLRRKYAEAMIAIALEKRLSKEDIFALYCNEIYLGQRGAVSIRGVEQAAHAYFGKELKDLTLAESATIAAMIKSPGRYAPDRNAEESKRRRNLVLKMMTEDGFITNEEAEQASSLDVSIATFNEKNDSMAPYFVDQVGRNISQQLSEESLQDEGGLRIYTTIDPELQQLADAAIKRQLEKLDKKYKNKQATPQGALVAIDPKTGNVIAMVGGRNYAESQLNRATDAMRQPGSTFKPFVYAAALERGYSPATLYRDGPTEFTYAGFEKYRPKNYGGGFSMREVTMKTALVKSLNVVTVEIAMEIGLSRVADVTRSFGLPKPDAYPSLALGTTETSPLALASAYTAFANEGVRAEPVFISKVIDGDGVEVISNKPQQAKVIKPSTAYMITDMLADAVNRGTASAARGALGKNIFAGKTGTSRDGWFVGYTPNLVCAVWIGFDDNKQLGLTGADAALPAWIDFVKDAIELRPELGGKSFSMPAEIVIVSIDPETGLLAGPNCPNVEKVALLRSMAPNIECYKHDEEFTEMSSFDYETQPEFDEPQKEKRFEEETDTSTSDTYLQMTDDDEAERLNNDYKTRPSTKVIKKNGEPVLITEPRLSPELRKRP